MSKITIVGGSSEIANAIADKLMLNSPGKYGIVLKLSTSLKTKNCISWNPSTAQGVKEGLQRISFDEGDVVIVALGSLGKTGKLDQILDFDNLADMYSINQVAPMLAISYASRELEKAGGGNIILLSSTAAFPILQSNYIYGSAKRELDFYGQKLQRSGLLRKTQITIVRSGFVQTKLNIGRTPTPFSRTSQEVAEIVVNNLNREIIWTPKIFKFISVVLQKVPLMKYIANILVDKSKS